MDRLYTNYGIGQNLLWINNVGSMLCFCHSLFLFMVENFIEYTMSETLSCVLVMKYAHWIMYFI
jgi:hypothetical protein